MLSHRETIELIYLADKEAKLATGVPARIWRVHYGGRERCWEWGIRIQRWLTPDLTSSVKQLITLVVSLDGPVYEGKGATPDEAAIDAVEIFFRERNAAWY